MAAFFCAAILSSCEKEAEKRSAKRYFNGSVVVEVPNGWVQLPLPIMRMHDPNDTIYSALVGTSKEQSMSLKMKRRLHMSISDISTRSMLDLYYKSNSNAKFLYLATDTIKNSLTVDYLSQYNDSKKKYFFRNIIFIKRDKWVYIEFHGEDSEKFRHLVYKTTNSIRVN